MILEIQHRLRYKILSLMLAPMGSNYLIIFYASLTIHIFATRLKDRDWDNSYTNTLVLESYVVQAFLDG